MFSSVDSYDNFVRELSMITYDNGKPFNPVRVRFILDNGQNISRKLLPMSEFEKAYKSNADILFAEFYDTELRVDISFSGRIDKVFVIMGAGYLGERSSEPVNLTFSRY